jgi:hypothetical protein
MNKKLSPEEIEQPIKATEKLLNEPEPVTGNPKHLDTLPD